MQLRDLSIGTRLIGGFGFIVGIMLIIAATGVFGMSEMEKAMALIHKENGTKVKMANTAFQSVTNISWAMRVIPYTSSPESLEALQKEIAASRAAYKDAMATVEQMEQGTEGKAIIARIKSTLGEAVQTNNQVLELAKLGKQTEALELQKNQAGALTAKIKDGFEALLKLEEASSAQQYQQAQATYRKNKIIDITLSLAALLSSVVLAVVLTRGITTPLQEAVSFADSISQGDLTARCSYVGRDEPGRMIAAMNTMAEGLTSLVSRITDISGTVSAASSQLKATSHAIATGTEEVAAQVITVATSSEEMAATSGDIAQNCQMAAETSVTASQAATTSASIVNESIQSMKRITGRVKSTAMSIDSLGTRSNQIGEIVGTIEDIADQTNLLALNAAIEAARAGEQGRGFAVVADEVRALAERTTRATREIGEMIKAIQTETKTAVTAMEEGVLEVERGSTASEKSGEALEVILAQIGEISMQVNQIATAAEEQTATTNEISGNIQEVIDVVQGTARGAEETASAAADLARQSQTLQSLVSQFKLA